MSSRFFDLLNSITYDLKRSVDLRWLFDLVLHSFSDELVLTTNHIVSVDCPVLILAEILLCAIAFKKRNCLTASLRLFSIVLKRQRVRFHICALLQWGCASVLGEISKGKYSFLLRTETWKGFGILDSLPSLKYLTFGEKNKREEN